MLRGREIESLVVIVNLVKGCGWMIKAPFPFWMFEHVSLTAVFKVVLCKN